MAVNLFDTAMEEYGGSDWHYTVLSLPARGAKAITDIESPVTVDMFIEHALRSTTGVRTTWALYDVQRAVAEMGVQSLAEAVATQNYATLPPELRPSGDVPDDAKLSIVAQNNGDGTMLVVKTYLFDKSKNLKDVMPLVRGMAYVPVYRKGPWAVKKAIQSLMDRIPGYHVAWSTVTERSQGGLKRKGSAERWNPPTDELAAGIEYINKNSPGDDALNEQFLWILENIKDESGSPVAGWPESKS